MNRVQTTDKKNNSNFGKKWTYQEESMLLEEINKNINIEIIAWYHKRSIGGIKARLDLIAYKLYSSGHTFEEIKHKTKLNEQQIIKIIKMKQIRKKKCKVLKKNKNKLTEYELTEIKNDIINMKYTMKELTEMIKAIYEFENE